MGYRADIVLVEADEAFCNGPPLCSWSISSIFNDMIISGSGSQPFVPRNLLALIDLSLSSRAANPLGPMLDIA